MLRWQTASVLGCGGGDAGFGDVDCEDCVLVSRIERQITSLRSVPKPLTLLSRLKEFRLGIQLWSILGPGRRVEVCKASSESIERIKDGPSGSWSVNEMLR